MQGILCVTGERPFELKTGSGSSEIDTIMSVYASQDSNKIIINNRVLMSSAKPFAKSGIFCVAIAKLDNYEDIKISTNHIYRTKDHAEAIAPMYKDHGTSFIRLIKGEFGFVLYDSSRNLTIAARTEGVTLCTWYSNGLTGYSSKVIPFAKELPPGKVSINGVLHSFTQI